MVSCHLSVGLWCVFKDLCQVLEEVYGIPVGFHKAQPLGIGWLYVEGFPLRGGLDWTLSTLIVLVVPTVCSASLGKISLVSIPVTCRNYCKSLLGAVGSRAEDCPAWMLLK